MITNGNIDSNMAIEYNILLSDITVLIDRDEKLTQHAIQLSEYATQLTKENNSLELTINELTTQNNELLAREQALTFQIEQLRSIPPIEYIFSLAFVEFIFVKKTKI